MIIIKYYWCLNIPALKSIFVKISSLRALLVLFVAIFLAASGQAQTQLNNLLLNQIGEIELIDGWKAISEDNFSRIDREFDFSDWQEVSTQLEEPHVDQLE